MPSGDWAAYFADKAPAAAPDAASGLTRAIAIYGKCYDARTDNLAASLARTGKGPTKAARADFVAFESALKDFTSAALENAQPQLVSQKAAHVSLYEKQFRYLFYQDYEAKTAKTAKSPAPTVRPPASPTPAPPPGATSRTAPTTPTTQDQARSDADPMTMAKNRFGKLLEALPDDEMHELHRAFGDVIGPHQISEAMRLAAYRYAIFILEPPSATPFSPPPL